MYVLNVSERFRIDVMPSPFFFRLYILKFAKTFVALISLDMANTILTKKSQVSHKYATTQYWTFVYTT
jgi:hypothetical protein